MRIHPPLLHRPIQRDHLGTAAIELQILVFLQFLFDAFQIAFAGICLDSNRARNGLNLDLQCRADPTEKDLDLAPSQ